jgi:endonuclease/exonuclease/phosphatase family metal-dependent hydrolase
MAFRVLTLNLWNISEPLAARFRELEAGLKQLRPDIVCLQEVYRDPASGRSQAELIGEMCGLAHPVEHSGLAILSATPAVRSDSVALPEFPGDFARAVLLAEFAVEGRPLLVANTHLAYPPELVQERRQQAETLLAAIERLHSRTSAKILCGDFNDVPESPAVRAVLNSSEKFRDVFGECHPGEAGFTYSPKKNRYVEPSWTVEQRIDYIFANAGLEPKNCSVVFDGSNGLDLVSDHYGVVGDLAFR